ncbi:kinesin-like protein kif28p [Dermatophagoides farinae]|uniref:Kinesin-like protein n=1 Tax=Dermatophagoides farinae TaxID=6954 RepID=A0A9D4NUT8_DERFA|nr:kinesin-like protein kif28p [Dermatophagoides farinae]
MVGLGANKGLVPRICEELFNIIDNRKGMDINTEVNLSMIELYSENVRDLLDTEYNVKKKGLKIREHPVKGFFAEGLIRCTVLSQKEILEKFEQGVTNRSISATNMNETSSRSHMIITITLSQRSINSNGNEETKTSVINLVDLAGSERLSDLAGGRNSVTGDRFRESVAINQSLSCLGNCIHALAEKANGRNVKVPYRESVLTRLLMNALGGNSKTAMIANISPADINYDETLSTLRYADRAKQIQNFAKINIDNTDKIIRDLKEENEKLKKLLEKESTVAAAAAAAASAAVATNTASTTLSKSPSQSFYDDDNKLKLEEEIEAIMKENERKLNALRQSYEERLQQERQERSHKELEENRKQIELEKQQKEMNPHLSNLNFDEQLVDKIIFIIKTGTNLIGKGGDCPIQLMGPLIQDHHAVINRTENEKIILERIDDECRILLNGDLVTHKVNLAHNDRLLFGTSQLFVFRNPLDSLHGNSILNVTYELAQEEIASKAGYNFNNDDNSIEQELLNKELLELIPAVEEANAISEELEKMVHFENVLVSPIFLGKIGRKPEPYVHVMNSNTGQEFLWNKEKFLDRMYFMKQMYHCYETGEEEWDVPLEEDPFTENLDAECLIGTAQLYLQPLAYMIEIKEHLSVNDFTGQEIGVINVEIIPCDENGQEYVEQDDVYVDTPQELLGKSLNFIIKIIGCRGLPNKFTEIYLKYLMFVDENYSISDKVGVTVNPNFNFKKLFHYSHVTQPLIDYLKEGILNIEIWGRQLLKSGYMIPPPMSNVPYTTINNGRNNNNNNNHHQHHHETGKELLQEELAKAGSELMNGFKMNGRVIDPNKQSIIVELLLLKKQQARMHQRINNIKKLIEIAEKQHLRLIPVNILKELIFTTSADSADDILSRMLNKTKINQ